jgi:hypothetical protein
MSRAISDGRRAIGRWAPRGRGAWVTLLSALLLMGTNGCAAVTVVAGGDNSGVSGQHAVWQVGVQATDLGGPATAMQVRIQTRQPQQVADQTTNYYWVGSYLRDGSFIQVGYFVPWYSSQQAGWFYCAYTPAKEQGPCAYGNPGSVGDDGSWHTYRLRVEQSAAGGATWEALLDDDVIGSFDWTAGDSGNRAPTIYAESSSPAPHKANSTLGPVSFTDFAVRVIDHQTDQLVTRGLPQYDATDICPPYGMQTGDDHELLLGSGLGCPGLLNVISWG